MKSIPPDSSQTAKLYAGCPGLITAFATADILQTLSLMFRRPLMSLGAYGDSDIQGVAQWPIDWKGPVGVAQRLPVRYIGLVTEPENVPASVHALQKALAKRRVGRAYYSFSPQYRLNTEELQHQLSEVGLAAAVRNDFEPLSPRPIAGREPPVIIVPNVACILKIEGTSEDEIIAAVSHMAPGYRFQYHVPPKSPPFSMRRTSSTPALLSLAPVTRPANFLATPQHGSERIDENDDARRIEPTGGHGHRNHAPWCGL